MPDQVHDPEALEELSVELAFAPLHKRCFGIAFGVCLAALTALATTVHLLRSPDEDYPLILLAQYFRGYEVGPLGVLIGAGWSFVVGFTLGWFFAFCRNLVFGLTAVFFRVRAEMKENTGFLDHI
jgi:hypothetical protein